MSTVKRSCLNNGECRTLKIFFSYSDPDIPIAPIVGGNQITAIQNKPVTIPCKPTTKDIEVELRNVDGEVIFEKNCNFSSKVGFTCSLDSQNNFAYCHPKNFSSDFQEHDNFFDVKVDEKRT